MAGAGEFHHVQTHEAHVDDFAIDSGDGNAVADPHAVAADQEKVSDYREDNVLECEAKPAVRKPA